MHKTAVVTGAGSGVGQAVALKLAERGWQIAIVGRRRGSLEDTIARSDGAHDRLIALPCDIGDQDAVRRLGTDALARLGSVEVLVNAAGTNVPRRQLDELSAEDYREMIDTNLNGAFYVTQAFLPGMRARQSGTIVHIVSDAGKQASPKAGAAYVMSKFGVAGLTQAINAEERKHGVRACAIFPGDIDTPLLDRRPNPPGPDARARMLRPEDVADCVLLAITLPARAVLEELIVRPRG